MTATAFGNKNLLLLGGLAAIAALLYLKGSGAAAPTGLTGGAGGYQGLAGGSSGEAPTIYQFPPEAVVNFPAAAGATLQDLMNLLGAAPTRDPTKDTTKKVDFMTNPVYMNPDGTPKLTMQAPAYTPKSPVLESSSLSWWDKYLADMTGALGADTGKKEITPSNFGATGTWSAAQTSTGGSADTKKGLASTDQGVFGLSGQYSTDPGTGYTIWSELFGMSTDPVTKKIVPWQRDIAIYKGSDLIYNPSTGVGNPKSVIDQQLSTWSPGPGALEPGNAAMTNAKYVAAGWFQSQNTSSGSPLASKIGTGGNDPRFGSTPTTPQTKKGISTSSGSGGSGGFGGGGGGGR